MSDEYVPFSRGTPVVRDVDGTLVIDWPSPRPAQFEISAEAFQALIDRANAAVCPYIVTDHEGTSHCRLAAREATP